VRNGLPASVLALFVVSGCVSQPHSSGAEEVRLQLGMHYLAAGDYAAAERNFLRAQAAAPEDYRVSLALARLAQQQGNQTAAQAGFILAQQQAPDNGFVANNYGAFLCALGQYDEAHQQFSRAETAPSSDARNDALELAGFCYLQAGDVVAARRTLRRAIEADRRKADSLLAEAEKQMAEPSGEGADFARRLPATVARNGTQSGVTLTFRRATGKCRRRFTLWRPVSATFSAIDTVPALFS